MSCSNWNREISPERNGRYHIDDIGLQRGLGLPLQIIGAPVSAFGTHGNSCSNRHQWHAAKFYPEKNGIPKKNLEDEIQQTIDGIPIRKLYITNICIDVHKDEMYYIFGRFGEIINVFIKISKNDTFKQFAFVTFLNPKDASRVLAIRKFQDFKGRNIYVAAADSWHQPKQCPDGRIIWNTSQKPQQNQDEDSEEEAETTLDSIIIPEEAIIHNGEGLNVLNDDCLLYVFAFLSFSELHRIEQVCKRWQGLSFRMWRCLHELDYSKPTFKGMQAKTPALEQYLKRCGVSLLVLDLRVSNHVFSESTLAVVAKYCLNLEVLRVLNIKLGNRSLAHLGRSCPKLKELVLDNCSHFNDKDLMSLIPKCPELSQINLSNIIGVTGRCFLNIQAPIKSLRLWNCGNIDSTNLIPALEKMSESLEDLVLNSCGNVRSSDVKSIVSAVPNLTSFSMCRCHPGLDLRPLTHINRLARLTKLDLSFNTSVCDNAVNDIVEGCESLSELNLAGCGGANYTLSARGLSLISRLRKLSELDISYLEATTDVVLKGLSVRNSRLKKLTCRGCPEISDEGCIQIMTMCNELELFDLSGCQQITEEVVKAALTSVKMRNNNVHLRFIVGGTEIESVEPNAEVPLLVVDLIDLCEEHLRPDFMNNMFFPPSDSEDEEDLDHLCCDCEFDYDDLFDPTFPCNDDILEFGTYHEQEFGYDQSDD